MSTYTLGPGVVPPLGVSPLSLYPAVGQLWVSPPLLLVTYPQPNRPWFGQSGPVHHCPRGGQAQGDMSPVPHTCPFLSGGHLLVSLSFNFATHHSSSGSVNHHWSWNNEPVPPSPWGGHVPPCPWGRQPHCIQGDMSPVDKFCKPPKGLCLLEIVVTGLEGLQGVLGVGG